MLNASDWYKSLRQEFGNSSLSIEKVSRRSEYWRKSNLDIISDLKETFKVPILAYHVSGEYLMIKSAAKKNVFNERDLVIETLTSIKRAGASSIITYYAKEAAKWMN